MGSDKFTNYGDYTNAVVICARNVFTAKGQFLTILLTLVLNYVNYGIVGATSLGEFMGSLNFNRSCIIS